MDDLGSILRSSYKRGGLSELGSLAIPWESVAGDMIAKHCRPRRFRKGVLYISASSPSWAHQLGYFKEEIMTKINSYAGRTLVRDVRIDGRGERPAGSTDEGTAPPDPDTLAALLSDDQLALIEEKTALVADDKLRERLRRAMIVSMSNPKRREDAGSKAIKDDPPAR